MSLYHYSAEPFVLDPHRSYPQQRQREWAMKPCGLWLSVEHDGEDSFGWRDWCVGESFHVEALTYRTELALRPEADVLSITNDEALLAFSARFEIPVVPAWFRRIDWAAVATAYRGIIIAPYLWSLRLDERVSWYYGWDCASGCIWDCTTLQQLDTSVPTALDKQPEQSDEKTAD